MAACTRFSHSSWSTTAGPGRESSIPQSKSDPLLLGIVIFFCFMFFFNFCYTESSDNLFFVVLFIRYFFILFMIFSNLGKYLLNLLYVSVDPFLCKESSQYLFFSTCFQIFIHWLSLLLLFLAKGYFHTSIRISQMPFYVLTALVILNLFV